MDDLAGDASNNIFKAVVGQNDLGQQVNTLGSGDTLDGEGGTDTLMAKVTAGVFAGGSTSMPIQAETTSIEIVKVEAVLAGVGTQSGRVDQVFVNAKDMTDVQQLWSDRSDADLTIMNLTTKGLEKLSDMTIGMAYTGNADSQWGASDMTVYFDQDYLTPEATRTNPVVDFLAMNEDAYDLAKSIGENPQNFALDGVFFRQLQFTLNGTKFNLVPFLGEDAQGTGAEIRSYTEFLSAVQSALVQLKAANPTNEALQSVTASFGQTFKTDVDPVTLVQREGVGIRLTVDGLTNGTANALSVASTDLEVARAANAIVPNNNRYEIADDTPPTDGEKLGINVALEKVGLAGDGGQLVIGSMNKESGNNWGAVNTVVDGTTSGIEEFYVTVYGSSAKSSSLAGLHSTNNNLRVVTVATDAAQTGTYADLTIGNRNTDMGGFLGYENALKDVQTFDASAFKGDLTLYAALTDQITAKYLNLVDAAPDAPGDDNLNFEYTGGTGNDNINLTISADNGAISGAATREDFLMNATINGGDGNDHITLAIIGNNWNSGPDIQDANGLAYASFGTYSNEDVVANWYDNQKLNANIRIDGGNGDDTIWTPGSGDIIIDGGAGNDTVYADNTGAKAVWAFNVKGGSDANRYQLNNLQSDANDKYKVFKTDVKVSFLGFEATARIADVKGVASDLDINQAIKKAINSDPVLSKLLLAQDGPANTLVVTSLIDGTRVGADADADADLDVALVAPAASAITAGELLQLATWYATPGLTAAAAKALIDGQVAVFNDNVGGVYNMDFARNGGELIGSNSLHTSDNHITGGLDNDVLVLGTGRLSNDTVVYKGFGNGTDSIVNFSTDNEGDTAVEMVGESEAAPESFTVTFSALTGVSNAASLTVLGTTIDLVGTGTGTPGVIPAVDVAYLVQDATVAGWTLEWEEGTANVTFTRSTTGNFDIDGGTAGDQDVVPGSFVFSGATGSVTISDYADGTDDYVPATPAHFEIDLNGSAAAADGTFAFTYDIDGAGAGAATTVNIAYKAGDAAITLANKFVAALNAGTDWVAETDNDGIVTAKKVAPGVLDMDANVYNLNTTAISTATSNGLVIDVATFADEDGVAQVGTAGTLVTIESMPLDYIDFSAYNAKAVYVDGVLVAGTVATAGQTYITLVESGTNDGSYTMTQYTEAGATDTVVGVIGVADFGAEQDFVAQNFIL